MAEGTLVPRSELTPQARGGLLRRYIFTDDLEGLQALLKERVNIAGDVNDPEPAVSYFEDAVNNLRKHKATDNEAFIKVCKIVTTLLGSPQIVLSRSAIYNLIEFFQTHFDFAEKPGKIENDSVYGACRNLRVAFDKVATNVEELYQRTPREILTPEEIYTRAIELNTKLSAPSRRMQENPEQVATILYVLASNMRMHKDNETLVEFRETLSKGEFEAALPAAIDRALRSLEEKYTDLEAKKEEKDHCPFHLAHEKQTAESMFYCAILQLIEYASVVTRPVVSVDHFLKLVDALDKRYSRKGWIREIRMAKAISRLAEICDAKEMEPDPEYGLNAVADRVYDVAYSMVKEEPEACPTAVGNIAGLAHRIRENHTEVCPETNILRYGDVRAAVKEFLWMKRAAAIGMAGLLLVAGTIVALPHITLRDSNGEAAPHVDPSKQPEIDNTPDADEVSLFLTKRQRFLMENYRQRTHA